MKQNIIIFIAFMALLSGSIILGKDLVKERKDNKRLKSNLASYDTKYTDLNLTKQEITSELSKSKSEYKVVDSLLKAEKAKPAQIKTLYIGKVSINNKDTSFVVNKDTLIRRDSLKTKLHKTPFRDERNCLNIEGYVMSTDQHPSVAITSQNAEIETYDITVIRKWWQFWKKKEKKITYTKCGDYQVIRMNRIQ